MKKIKFAIALLFILTHSSAYPSIGAVEEGDPIVRAGYTNLNTKSNNRETIHLPPTITRQSYFNSQARIRAYAGLGIKHTIFFTEKTSGVLDGTTLKIDSSTDLVYQIDFDWFLSVSDTLNLAIRKFKFEAEADMSQIDITQLKQVLPDRPNFSVLLDRLTVGLSLTYAY